VKVDFLYIGPDKAGSTWLDGVLRQHRSIVMPKSKELFYFDRYYNLGDNWYRSQFSPGHINDSGRRLGEISHDYLYSEDAAKRIFQHNSAVRLIVNLRNPIDRAVSAYRYLKLQGRTFSSFDKAILEHSEIIDHGRYYKYISMYLKYFDRSQIYFGDFQDLTDQPRLYVNEVLDHIGVESDCELSPERQNKNSFRYARAPHLNKFLRSVASGARAIGRPELVTAVKTSRLVNWALFSSITADPASDVVSLDSREYIRLRVLDDAVKLSEIASVDYVKKWDFDKFAGVAKCT